MADEEHVKGAVGKKEKEKQIKRVVQKENGGAQCSEKPFDHPVYKKLALINGEINKMTKRDLQTRLETLRLDTRGVKEVLKKRLKNYYKKQKLMTANVGQGAKEPCYDYYLVIDFEATCDENNFNYKHEIIEFPIVLVDSAEREVVGEFHAYVKPTVNPHLTPFCTQLTGITQEQVDSSEAFPEVLERVNLWIEQHNLGTSHTFAVITDGPWDMGRFMYHQCKLLSLPFPPWASKWCNIRKCYGNFYRCQKVKLTEMLHRLGMQFEGSEHSGIDDARNIARILIRLLQDGASVRLNERLYDGKLMKLEKDSRKDGEASSSDSEEGERGSDADCNLVESLANVSINSGVQSEGEESAGDLFAYYKLQNM